ncbi:citrate synthase [Ectothiorhodosinus mongolicus]|uniref:Citrate synthase n=1 Tax=Ectothiorhodosinus mongolicus TaxID=233100 RepID=A0A1R3W654_9GAMM|nr:citrate synthase [Ectothiorhodosinus mongolicus]ULX57606.1 citrate synthase [Ectothiorhodosinus mongolicus]SIT73072.1 citrate synthase [Ectothiorhodosinus mongolicus]
MTNRTVTVIDNATGKQVELPVLEGTIGPATVDIRPLSKELGYFTYDPGFMSTASCRSDITYIDGDEGILMYRGYPIEELAEHSTYLETCYLLFYGELPTATQLQNFQRIIQQHSVPHQAVRRFYDGFRHDAHPMAIMVGVFGALSAFFHDEMDVHNPKHREIAAHRMISKMPTLAAWSYKYAMGQPFIYPDNELSYSENFLRMMFGMPTERYEPNPVFAKALDLILILHADHEQNASTSTVRLSGSSEANPYAAVSAGIASLWGPLHGGANEKVVRMLEDIVESGQSVEHFVNRAKDKDDSYRLMGFGHRVYKNYDPRARIIRKMCHELLAQMGSENEPMFEVAMELERYATEDDYFKERKLYPNVDFYSGIILKAMGIPLNMFTAIFALARIVGWNAHWNEMMQDPESRIGRPRQLYTGADTRVYVPIEKR